jgi:hypothetical protein
MDTLPKPIYGVGIPKLGQSAIKVKNIFRFSVHLTQSAEAAYISTTIKELKSSALDPVKL